MSEQQGEIAVGGLYAVRNEDGSFGIYKVLAVDGFAVSLRKYTNKFLEVPARVDPAALSFALDLEAIKRGDVGALGIGHFPIARDGFLEMEPALVQVEPVADNELDGYRAWRDAPPEPESEVSSVRSIADQLRPKKWWEFWK